MENEEWSLEDDFKLVNAIFHCGYGNWVDVAARFSNRSPQACKNRYLNKFIINPDNEEFKEIADYLKKLRNGPSLCNSNCNLSVVSKPYKSQSLIEFLDVEQYVRELCDEKKKESFTDRKLTFLERTKNVMSDISCDSYNPYRSEFEVEYDDNAEAILELLWEPPDNFSFSHDEDNLLMEELKYALVDSYNFRLSERINRKKIIRNLGLIDRRKTYSMVPRYDVPFGSTYLSALFPFMRFFSGPELDFFVEKLLYENELRSKVNSLITYRGFGIRFLSGTYIYEKLNKKRLKYRKEIGHSGVLTLDGKRSRKSPGPLALYNLPGFHLLDEEEKELCSSVRIVPETYYNFKKLLKSECSRNEGLKLAQARQLLKIDVNKTRKIYDYLMSTGDIW